MFVLVSSFYRPMFVFGYP